MAGFSGVGGAALIACLNENEASFESLAARILAEAEATCPVSNGNGGPEGHLRDHLETRVIKSDVGPRILVGSTLRKTAFIIYGAPPHQITKAWPSALQFQDQFTYRQSVNSPGTAGNDFLRQAARRVLGGI